MEQSSVGSLASPSVTRVEVPAALWLIGFAVLLRLIVYAALAQPFGGLAEAMCRFDCGWYERIALAGYDADAEWPPHGSLPHWAFFPLYPMALRFAVDLTGLPARWVGIVLSSLFLAGFMAAGAAYLRRTRGRQARPGRFILLAAAMPGGLFFSGLYTEALFALLTTLALLGLATERAPTTPLAGAVAAALASAARATGILLAPVFALRALRDLRRLGPRALLPAMIVPLGLLTCIAAQWIAVGDPLAFLHVQALWDRSWRGPIFYLTDGLAAWDWAQLGGLMAEPSRSFSATCGLIGLATAATLAARRQWTETWLLAMCVLVPAASGLDSLPRYVACNPVFLFATHDALARLGRIPAAITLTALAALGLVPVLAWMQGHGGVF
jgi:hypothetical protein